MNIVPPKILFPRTRSLWFGLTLPYRALKLIFINKSLLFWSALPLALTFILFIYGISQLQDWAISLLQDYVARLGFDPASLIGRFFMLSGKMILCMVAALTFIFTSSIVASPFNDILAERSERVTEIPLPPVTKKMLKAHVKLIGIDLFKTATAFFAAVFAIVFCWVPIVNIFAFILAFLLVTFQYISYPQTRRSIGLRQGAKFLWHHIYACTGFGAIFMFLFAVPFLSSFILPLAVVGGTLLAARAPGSSQLSPLK
ncbi:MAG: EI24 domain-containing protein [Planctomycetota bacterium]